jgi:hypothetical protein
MSYYIGSKCDNNYMVNMQTEWLYLCFDLVCGLLCESAQGFALHFVHKSISIGDLIIMKEFGIPVPGATCHICLPFSREGQALHRSISWSLTYWVH